MAVAHRELTILAAAALCLLDLWHGGWRAPAVRARWGLAFLLVAAFRGIVDAVRPFGSMFGPGSIARADGVDLSSQAAISSQICLDPSRWAARGGDLVLGHLPTMVGGHPGPLLESSINSGMGAGNPGLPLWVATLVLVAVAIGVARVAPPGGSRGPAAADGAPDDGAAVVPVPHRGVLDRRLLAGRLFGDHAGHVALRPAGAAAAGRRAAGGDAQPGGVRSAPGW